jgi:hypothetical protein
MAGADLVLSMNAVKKKLHLFKEFDSEHNIVFSSENISLFLKDASVVVLKEEVRLLASLLSVCSLRKPSLEILQRASEYPRIAKLIKNDGLYEIIAEGAPVGQWELQETLIRAVSSLNPRAGELLTIYYGLECNRPKFEEHLPLLQKEFPILDDIELYFGGQEIPFIISLE